MCHVSLVIVTDMCHWLALSISMYACVSVMFDWHILVHACLPVCLSGCLLVSLPFSLYACRPLCLSACLYTYPPCLLICLPPCLSACAFVPACLTVCLPVNWYKDRLEQTITNCGCHLRLDRLLLYRWAACVHAYVRACVRALVSKWIRACLPVNVQFFLSAYLNSCDRKTRFLDIFILRTNISVTKTNYLWYAI